MWSNLHIAEEDLGDGPGSSGGAVIQDEDGDDEELDRMAAGASGSEGEDEDLDLDEDEDDQDEDDDMSPGGAAVHPCASHACKSHPCVTLLVCSFAHSTMPCTHGLLPQIVRAM